jgi:hypothetical protein
MAQVALIAIAAQSVALPRRPFANAGELRCSACAADRVRQTDGLAFQVEPGLSSRYPAARLPGSVGRDASRLRRLLCRWPSRRLSTPVGRTVVHGRS